MIAIADFRRIIYTYYETAGRRLPWREDLSPWGVLVSELMLQQTTTDRVTPYWIAWMNRWPTPESLKQATLAEALAAWSGLGYNRRCRYLKECAACIVDTHHGMVPDTPEVLETLPGIGPYTSGAVACFAYNYPSVFIETNIRAVAIHFFFPAAANDLLESDSLFPNPSLAPPPPAPRTDIPPRVADTDLIPFLEEAMDWTNPRRWHWALMDYGAALKKVTNNPNRRSAHYTKQSRFEGSFRQRRGAVIRTLINGPADLPDLAQRTGFSPEDLRGVIRALIQDTLVTEDGPVFRIS